MDLGVETAGDPVAAVDASVALPGICFTGVLREHADDVLVDVDGRALGEAADQILGFCADAGYVLLSAADADVTFQIIGPIYLERSVPARRVGTGSMQVVLDRLAVTRLAGWSPRYETVRLRVSPRGCSASVVDVVANQDVPSGGALFDRQALLIKASDAAAGSLRFRIQDGQCRISGGDGRVLVAAAPDAAAADVTVPARVVAEAAQSGFGPDLLITITPGPTLVIRFGAAGGFTIALGACPGIGDNDGSPTGASPRRW